MQENAAGRQGGQDWQCIRLAGWPIPTLPLEGNPLRTVVTSAEGITRRFQQLDTDQDGQIGLYEWRTSGRPIDEFEKYDRNGDGFLTIEEVLYDETAQAEETRWRFARGKVSVWWCSCALGWRRRRPGWRSRIRHGGTGQGGGVFMASTVAARRRQWYSRNRGAGGNRNGGGRNGGGQGMNVSNGAEIVIFAAP